MLGGAIRVSTPFMFVALGECLTEKSGRINLGLEGTLVLGAMVGLRHLLPHRLALARRARRRRRRRMLLGALHGYICKLPRVNDIAIGIAMMLFGTGLAFFFGKPYIQPTAPRLPLDPARRLVGQPGSSQPALQINPLFLVGIALAVVPGVGLPQHALGPDRAHDRRQRRRPRAPWASRSTWCASSPPPSAASSPASAAPSCRSTTPAPGTRACRRARA